MQVPKKGEKMHVKGALCRIHQLLFVNTPFQVGPGEIEGELQWSGTSCISPFNTVEIQTK